MNIPFNDLAPGVAAVRAEVDRAIARVLDRGWFILGPENEAFEHQFAAYLGAQNAVAVANGTEAIAIALQSAGIGAGDEVIVPALTAGPTLLAVLAAGARPVIADVHPDTFTLDPARLDECFGERVRAILPVHLYGLPADLPAILSFAQQHNLMVIEDCAQSHGAQIDGQMSGTFGAIGCFSFYPTKNLGAYGDGGALVTADSSLADRARSLGNLGQENRFQHVLPGWNSRLDEIQAAILQVLLGHLEENIALRRQRAGWYAELLSGVDDLARPAEPSGFRHVYHLYVVRHARRDDLRRYLTGRGIGCDVHYPIPMHRQPAFADCRVASGGLPVAEHLVEEILSLPMYPHLTRQQVEAVCEAIHDFGK